MTCLGSLQDVRSLGVYRSGCHPSRFDDGMAYRRGPCHSHLLDHPTCLLACLVRVTCPLWCHWYSTLGVLSAAGTVADTNDCAMDANTAVPMAASRFVDAVPLCVREVKTSLMWQSAVSTTLMWQSAVSTTSSMRHSLALAVVK